MYQFQFQIPPYYTLLVRSLSVLEVRRGAHLPGHSSPPSAHLPTLPSHSLLSGLSPAS